MLVYSDTRFARQDSEYAMLSGKSPNEASLDRRIAELEGENKRLTGARSKGARGADPVAYRGGASGQDFMELAQEYQREHNCGITEAMSAVAKAHPEVHAEYVAAARQAKPREIVKPKSK